MVIRRPICPVFFFQAEDGIRVWSVTGVQTCALPISTPGCATKCTMPTGSGPNDRGASRKHIRESCDASLRRLGTDYIDLYQIHAEDLWTPLEETLAALDDLVRAGKVLYVGASNFRAYRLMKALALSDRHGWARFVSLQPQYNLIVRTIEREHFALATEEGLGLITWSPLAAGMLTGKITRERKPPESRPAQRDMPP